MRRTATSELNRYVDDMGAVLTRHGLPPIAGRMLGTLLVCDPPHLSLGELARTLRASKASISTMARLLERVGLVERVRFEGDRRDHVRIPEGAFARLATQMLDGVSEIERLAARGLEVLAHAPPSRRARLRDMHDLYGFLRRELPALVRRFEARKRT